MSSFYTTNTLIDSIKRRAAIPEAQETFKVPDFLAFINEEIAMGILPSIMRLHEDYLLYTQDVPVVQNQTRYSIPDRAVGNKLRELAYKDSNGNIFEMTRINIEDLPDYNGPQQVTNYYTYYIENNDIVLVPKVGSTASGSLVVSYYLRPNQMVEETRVGVIQSINFTTGEIIVSDVPSVFNLSQKYDLVKAKSPFKTLKLDLTSTTINPTTNSIIFNASDLPSTLSVGDYVCLAEETIVPQIPSELHVMLAHRVAARCLEAQGDLQGLQAANQKLAEMENNRVEGSPRKVINRHGFLRQGLFSRKFRYRN